MARLELSPQLLVLLALAMLAPTFPVRAFAQSNDITLSLGGTPSQSRGFRSPTAGTAQTSADISWELTTAIVFWPQKSQSFMAKSNLWLCPIEV